METLLLTPIAVLIAIFIGVFGVFGVLLVKLKKPGRGTSDELLFKHIENITFQLGESIKNSTDSTNKQLLGITEQVNKQLGNVTDQMLSSQKTVGERLDNATKVVGDVQRGLGALSEATQKVFDVGKNISTLQDILRAPKLRGNIGELILGDLLSQVLPKENYTLQHTFNSGEKVDAAINIGENLVPVDAKFPLENFKKLWETKDDTERKHARKKFITDVKKHVDVIKTKYILPDEGTFDFALMYIPAENVYYETIIKDDSDVSISSYAIEKKVIPVSPNSFYAYLQAIVMGLRGMQIEKRAKDIMQYISQLKGDFARFGDDFETLGKHVNNVKNKYDDSSKRFEKLNNKLELPLEKEAEKLS